MIEFLIALINNVIFTLVLTGTIGFLVWHGKGRRVRRLMSKFPGPTAYPLIGSVLELNVPNEEMAKLQFKFEKLYGPRYNVKVGPFYHLSLSQPKDIEKILSSSIHTSKGKIYDLIKPWLGDGLLTSNHRKWQARRKMLTPTFHFKILEDFLPILEEQANVLVGILKREFSGGQVMDMFPYVTRCTLDIICETAMGTKLNSQMERNTPYVQTIHKMCGFLQYRLTRPWLRPEFLWRLTSKGREELKCLKILHEFTDRVIKERKAESLKVTTSSFGLHGATGAGAGVTGDEELEDQETIGGKSGKEKKIDDIYWKGKRRLAFLDLLIEAQKNADNQLKDSDLREEVDTFMFEGHDTTSASINWTLFLLGTYKEHQVKVHEELDEIFGSDKKRLVTTQDLARMKYLDLVIKESLRLYPSVPLIARFLTSDCVLDDGMVLPAGISVFLFASSIHRNEKIFPEPEKFCPERFLPENCVGRHPFAYIPFSAGPRNCIGQKFAMMEAKVVVGKILRNFEVEAAQKLEDVIVMNEVITRPKGGLLVKFIPRPRYRV